MFQKEVWMKLSSIEPGFRNSQIALNIPMLQTLCKMIDLLKYKNY